MSSQKVYATLYTEHCTDEDEITIIGMVHGGHGRIEVIDVDFAKCQTCQDEVILTERDYLRAEDAIEQEVANAA